MDDSKRLADLEAELAQLRERLPPEKFEPTKEQLEAEAHQKLQDLYAGKAQGASISWGEFKDMTPLKGCREVEGPIISNPTPTYTNTIVTPKAYRG